MYFTKIALSVVFVILLNDLAEGNPEERIKLPLYAYKYDKDNINLRARRSPQGEAKISATHGAGGSSLRGELGGTLLHTDRSKLDGNAYYQRNWGQGPKYDAGAGLTYNHDSGAFGSVNYNKQPGQGTLGAKAGYNFFESRNGRTKIGAEAFYDRNFGGFGPRQNYGGMFTLRRDF